jgi:hypothetical protein
MDNHMSYLSGKQHMCLKSKQNVAIRCKSNFKAEIKLLEIYSQTICCRTGSKLGISPLMLAAMNGHTQAVKLLLDMGSDINAQVSRTPENNTTERFFTIQLSESLRAIVISVLLSFSVCYLKLAFDGIVMSVSD